MAGTTVRALRRYIPANDGIHVLSCRSIVTPPKLRRSLDHAVLKVADRVELRRLTSVKTVLRYVAMGRTDLLVEP